MFFWLLRFGSFLLKMSNLQLSLVNTDKLCRVCGEKAISFNYNGLACESCKTFFRRNAFKPNNLPECPNNNKCQLNRWNRTNCRRCRLDQCFGIGMKKEFIWKSKYTQKYLKLTIENMANYRIRSLQLNKREVEHLHEIQMAIGNIPEENSLEIIGIIKSMDQFFHLPPLYITKFIKYCKSLSAYKCLNETDQLALIKSSYVQTLNIRFAFCYNPETNEYPIMANMEGTKGLIMRNELLFEMKQNEVAIRLMKFMTFVHMLLEDDVIIRNLTIVQFLFANYESILCNPEFIRYQHCFYCTLLLRYFEHKYQCSMMAKQKYYTLMQALQEMDYQIEKIRGFYVNNRELTQRDQVHKEIFNL